MSEIILELHRLFTLNNVESIELDENINHESVVLLQRQSWQGKLCSEGLRGICWRYFLGLLPGNNFIDWKNTLSQSILDYETLKRQVNPSIDQVEADPLSSLGNGGQQSQEWQLYYRKLEMASLVKVDLDRLYMPGIDDNYFHDPIKKERLLSVLLVWSLKHNNISYRQGMHEIVGTISYVLDTEVSAWESVRDSGLSHTLSDSFTESTEEAYIYWLFERIMNDMIALYDPIPINKGPESVPQIVDYCSRIQEHFLRQIDPELCEKLEECYIQGQIYGLRWARLLLGREFSLSHSRSLRLWDYMFASCWEGGSIKIASAALEELSSAQASVSSASIVLRERYGSYSPLMGVLGDLMLAMLLHIREALVEGDSNDVLGLLMKYPNVDDVTPIMDLADMIRRGVLNCGAHITKPRQQSPLNVDNNRFINIQQSNQQISTNPPPWLLSHPILPVINANTLNNMGRKMTEQISAVSSAVKERFRNPTDSVSFESNTSTVSSTIKQVASVKSSQPFDPFTDPLLGSIAIQPTEVTIKRRLFGRQSSPNPRVNDESSTPINLFGSSEVKQLNTPKQVDVIASNNAVADRLLNISDYVLASRDVSFEQNDKLEIARRIRLLADVLSGLTTVNEYDNQIAIINSSLQLNTSQNNSETLKISENKLDESLSSNHYENDVIETEQMNDEEASLSV